MAKKNKILTSGIAVVSAAALLFGGTFAWQSISQTALNEISGTVNPGGRLHDDFHEITAELKKTAAAGETITMTYDKDVYVENFTEYAQNGVQVYARVRLDEYMEMGGVSLVDGAEKDDKTTWSTYLFGEDSDFRDYWEMKFGGQTIYMPTFNRNKDSLEADINGTSDDDFKSYVDYSETDVDGNYNPQTSYAVYDRDNEESGKEIDEIAKQEMLALSTIIAGGEDALNEGWDTENYGEWRDHIAVEQETHTPRETIDGGVVSMADYMKWLNDENDAFDGKGNFWVYDTDGWAYWAMPIDPETATGLLLDQISRTSAIINQDWYYAINVVAQFITYDDMGQDDNTGFYDLNEGTYPTADALTLLKTIGVDVETTVANEEALLKAMAQGKSFIILTNDITLSAPLTITDNISLDLNGYSITSDGHFWNEEKKTWSLISVDGGSLDIYNNGGSTGGLFAEEGDCYCVDVRSDGKLTINGGTFKGNISAVYVFEGEATINGGNFSIQQTHDTAKYKYLLNCYDENYAAGKARITVNGGNFSGGPWSEVSDELYDGFMTYHDGFDPAVPCEADRNSYLGEGVTTIRTNEIDTEKFQQMQDQGLSIDEITEEGRPLRWLVMVVPAD